MNQSPGGFKRVVSLIVYVYLLLSLPTTFTLIPKPHPPIPPHILRTSYFPFLQTFPTHVQQTRYNASAPPFHQETNWCVRML
jgi:hypothetical protein